MNIEKPEFIGEAFCCDCNQELMYVGHTPSGIVQRFCSGCNQRRDVLDHELLAYIKSL